jgi:hypothetical protein
MSLNGRGARAVTRRVQLEGVQMGAIALAFERVVKCSPVERSQ